MITIAKSENGDYFFLKILLYSLITRAEPNKNPKNNNFNYNKLREKFG